MDLEGSGARNVEIYVRQGLAGEKIVAFVKKENCDLIVMSAHGRSGLGRVLLGSVTDYVVRHASCPVLVVRAKNKY